MVDSGHRLEERLDRIDQEIARAGISESVDLLVRKVFQIQAEHRLFTRKERTRVRVLMLAIMVLTGFNCAFLIAYFR